MRIEKIIKELESDKIRLEKKYAELNLDKIFAKTKLDKVWPALVTHGILTGYRFYLDRIKELRGK